MSSRALLAIADKANGDCAVLSQPLAHQAEAGADVGGLLGGVGTGNPVSLLSPYAGSREPEVDRRSSPK